MPLPLPRRLFRRLTKPTAMFVTAFAFLAVMCQRDAAADEIRKPRLDLFGDPLPEEAVARIGSSRMRHPGYIHKTLAFSADGKTLISSAGNGVRLWDTATGKLRRRFDLAIDWIDSFAHTAEGILVAGAGLEKGIITLQLFDPANGNGRRRLQLSDWSRKSNAALSRDGKWLAYGHSKDVRLHETASGREVLRLPATRKITFAADGKLVIFCDFSDTVCVYETAGGKCVHCLKHRGDRVTDVAISADGHYLASLPSNDDKHPGEFSIWDLQTGTERHRLRVARGCAFHAAFSPEGKYVAVGCQCDHLLLFDVADGKEVRRFPTDAYFASIAFSPDGKALAATSGVGTIRLWETATGRVLPASADPLLDSVHKLYFSGDGRRLLGCSGIYFAWEPSNGRELRRFPKVSERNWRAALSPDESLLAADADSDGTLRLWDTKTGREVRALKGDGNKWVTQRIFSPDGRRLITTNAENGIIRIWDVAEGREIGKLTNASGPIGCMAVSPDGHWLASASDQRGPRGYEVLLWDLAKKREIKRMLQNSQVLQLAFSPDSRLLAAAGGDRDNDTGEVQVWDVSGEQQRRWFVGHKKWGRCVAISPDNRTLATGDGNGEVCLWELASNRRRHRFVGHESWIKSLAFSPDGRLLASSSYDAPVYVWDVVGVLQARQRHLSNDELQRFWTVLSGDDAAAAFQAIRRLVAMPKQTISFIHEHLKPALPPDRKRIRQLVEMLDSADFSTRQKATEELEKQTDAAAGLLRQILAKEKPSLEIRQRLQQILEGIESKPDVLRAIRAVEVLEWIATPDAVRLIGELAGGAADARLTREASAARRRLAR